MKLSPSTTNAKMLDNLMSRLGGRKAADLRAQLVFELNGKINQLEGGPMLPWFLQKETSGIIPAGARSLSLPLDFLREEEEDAFALYVDNVFLRTMHKVDTEELFGAYGPTECYALSGESFLFEPAFTLPTQYFLRYFGATEEVVDDENPVSNLWIRNAYNFVTFAALKIVARDHVKDKDSAERFGQSENEAANTLWRFNEARQHANRNYMIED